MAATRKRRARRAPRGNKPVWATRDSEDGNGDETVIAFHTGAAKPVLQEGTKCENCGHQTGGYYLEGEYSICTEGVKDALGIELKPGEVRRIVLKAENAD